MAEPNASPAGASGNSGAGQSPPPPGQSGAPQAGTSEDTSKRLDGLSAELRRVSEAVAALKGAGASATPEPIKATQTPSTPSAKETELAKQVEDLRAWESRLRDKERNAAIDAALESNKVPAERRGTARDLLMLRVGSKIATQGDSLAVDGKPLGDAVREFLHGEGSIFLPAVQGSSVPDLGFTNSKGQHRFSSLSYAEIARAMKNDPLAFADYSMNHAAELRQKRMEHESKKG
jgi:hypothetical protein